MCGIAGVFQYRRMASEPLDERLGLRMIDALVHRGPDSGGLLATERLLLGHRRLAILDLSPRGHQPMHEGNEQYWIAFNGEIYNFAELRRELEAAGHRFHSNTDTEVILRGYLEWGQEVVTRLNGMFAFAIWDRQEDQLWLVRDPMGIKPLFYHDDGNTLRFGSEIKAILADPAVARRPDLEAIDAFLTLGYVAAPVTGFQAIRQLQPGEWLRAGPQGVTRQRWYALPYPDAPPQGDLRDAVNQLHQTIQHAVQRQMISDVPVGALLSGGLDSSVVVRAMRRSGRADIETFSAAFGERTFDESPYAEQVARHYGTRHHNERIAADIADLLPILVSHAEEPLADNSMIPFYLLSQFVRRRVTVALSGDGADELLGGYDTYRASQWAPWYRAIPRSVRSGVITPLVERIPPSQSKYALANVLRRFIAGAEEPPLRDHCSWRRIVSRKLRSRLLTDSMLSSSSADAVGEYAASAADAPAWLTPFEKQLHVDLRFHLPNDILVKTDRMSMAHSLEVRVPLLDLEVVRTSLAIAPHLKRRGKRGKLVLREMLRNELPDAIVQRRKAGFLVPLEAWTRGAWQPYLRQHLTEEFASDTGLFRWTVIREMLDAQAAGREDYAYPLFTLLMLSLWWRIWITGGDPVRTQRPEANATQIMRLNTVERRA